MGNTFYTKIVAFFSPKMLHFYTKHLALFTRKRLHFLQQNFYFFTQFLLRQQFSFFCTNFLHQILKFRKQFLEKNWYKKGRPIVILKNILVIF